MRCTQRASRIAKRSQRLGEDALALGLRQRGVGLVAQARRPRGRRCGREPSLRNWRSAPARASSSCARSDATSNGVRRDSCERGPSQPPDTGGMNAISLPSRGGVLPARESAVDRHAQALAPAARSRGARAARRTARAGGARSSQRSRASMPAASRRLAKYSTVTRALIRPSPTSRLPPRLADQLRRADHDRVRQRLAHVVDGERGDGRAGQRFHLHAGAMRRAHRAVDGELACVRPVDRDAAAVDRQRMAERDQFVGALDRHRAGDDRGVDDRALRAAQAARRAVAAATSAGNARGIGARRARGRRPCRRRRPSPAGRSRPRASADCLARRHLSRPPGTSRRLAPRRAAAPRDLAVAIRAARPRCASAPPATSSPCRTAARRSWPSAANRQVYSVPSADTRARWQSPQNGALTELTKPTSPAPSSYA